MNEFELTLRDYVNLFLRKWWVVAAALVSCIVLALLWSSQQTPQYRSSASILVNQVSAADLFDPVGTRQSFAGRVTANEARFLQSGLVSSAAIDRLGYSAGVTVRTDNFTDILEVVAESDDPNQAQEIAQTFAETYIDVRRERFANERLNTAATLVLELEEVDGQIETAEGEELVRLQVKRRDLADRYDLLNLAVEVSDDGAAQIIDEAFRPISPFSPQVRRDFLLGAALGLLLGVGIVLLTEALDRSVKSREMLEALTPGAPNLALIPSLGRAVDRPETLVALHEPGGTSAEAFRTLRAALQYAAVDEPIQVLQVASAHSAAGKTTIAANLALTIAASGQSVAVIDGDLRRPRMHELFGVPQVPGLSSAIVGVAPLSDSIHEVDTYSHASLKVVPSGPIPPGPAELLGSEAGQATLDELRALVDVVILDTPPVLAVADTMVLSRYVDATILVVDAKKTNRADVRRAYELLQAGAPVVGTVLNRAKIGAAGGYGYGYQPDTSSRSGFGSLFGRGNGGAADGVATMSRTDVPRLEAPQQRRAAPAKAAEVSQSERPKVIRAGGPEAAQAPEPDDIVEQWSDPVSFLSGDSQNAS